MAEYIGGKTDNLLRLTEDSSGKSLEEGENGGAELALLQQGPDQAGEQRDRLAFDKGS
jgi:hypothetical protein